MNLNEIAQISIFESYDEQFQKACKGVVKLEDIWKGAGMCAYQMTSLKQGKIALRIRNKVYDHNKEIEKLEKKQLT